ncbi:hypothetical protein [Hydrogenophaga flava]|uniref:hypothetical protein n=1 Tax=Hydrogenophaga flava TaxID=65657 RepID=UPI0012FCE2A6|nr:hypothetical protein [Hydrogenophaga flava]
MHERTCWVVLGSREIHWGEVVRGEVGAHWMAMGSVPLSDEARGSRSGLASTLTALLPALPFSSAEAGTPLHLWLDDVWVPMGMVPWSDALLDDRSASASARSALMELGYDLHSGDSLRLDYMPWGQPRLAIAYPTEVLAWIEDRSTAWNVPLAGVHAGAVAGWSALAEHSSASALAVLTDEHLVVMGAPSGARRLAEFHPVALGGLGRRESDVEGLSAAEVERAWRRLTVRHPQWEAVDGIALLNCATHGQSLGELPGPFQALEAAWPTDSDGVQGQSLGDLLVLLSTSMAPHALSWSVKKRNPRPFLVLTAVASCLGLAAMVVAMGQQLRAEAVLDESISGWVQRSAPTRREPPLTKQEAARVPAVNQAIRQLNLPVQGLLQALEPPKDLMVAVLSVDSVGQVAASGQSSSVRIVAQTPNSADMTRYVAFVGGRRPFTGAYLRKHEWVDASRQKQVRFTLEATWNE